VKVALGMRHSADRLLALYVLVLLGLGIRALLPMHWDIGLLGRELGGWSMYGSELSDLRVVAKAKGKKLRIDGFWHTQFAASATPRLAPEVVTRYAAWLHERHDLLPTQPVSVEVRYRIDRGLARTVKVEYP